MNPMRSGRVSPGCDVTSIGGRRRAGCTRWASSKNVTVSRTVRVSTESVTIFTGICAELSPMMRRPRVGLRPTRPHVAAGMRIEPPPSLPCAMGTTPDATSAAEPPEEPPELRDVSHGLRVTLPPGRSVVAVQPNGGIVVVPMGTMPVPRICVTTLPLRRLLTRGIASEPCVIGTPATTTLSLNALGTPRSAASG